MTTVVAKDSGMTRTPTTTPAPGTKHVVVIVESSSTYGRSCAQGIARYARNHGRWLIRHMPHNEMPVLNPNVPWKWEWDGVIARIANRRLRNLVKRLNLPTVDIMGAMQLDDVVVVDADHQRIVELATDHLLSGGLTHLAFCGVPGLAFSDQRQRMFEDVPLPQRITRHVYRVPKGRSGSPTASNQRWWRDLKSMRAWLERLPKPVGIVACNDTRARHVAEVCLAAGLDVPRDVAVIGVDNDDLICEISTPRLSSVDPNAETIGYEAARALDELMDGRKPRRRPIRISPLGIERRGSSDVQAFDHRDIDEAIRFIREHSDDGINVSNVVAKIGVSRSTLERRFRDLLGCTVHEYIHRRRMERVRRLLLETNYTAARIAEMTGFSTSTYFGATFRKHTGMTPGQFRRKHTGTA